MSSETWHITYEVYRQKEGEPPRFDRFSVDISPDAYVLDGVEKIWARQDRSLTFRHACHHATCGACGMRVNGVEKLSCITRIRAVTHDGGTLRVEPLRNFPLISDLAVDMSKLYAAMDQIAFSQIVPVGEAPLPNSHGIAPAGEAGEGARLADCIECGLCVSACSICASDPDYLGPAALAALHQRGLTNPDLLDLADNQDGLWRCHSQFECSAVCPSFVEPGWRIMELRRQVVKQRLSRLFHRKDRPQ